MKFCFGDIVVVDGLNIGVIVKSWKDQRNKTTHDIYVRVDRSIREMVPEDEIERYMVRHKHLSDEELEYQANSQK